MDKPQQKAGEPSIILLAIRRRAENVLIMLFASLLANNDGSASVGWKKPCAVPAQTTLVNVRP